MNRKKDSAHLVETLQSILTSNRSNDEISGELVELLGYDELDNVIGIINDRESVIEQVCPHSLSHMKINSTKYSSEIVYHLLPWPHLRTLQRTPRAMGLVRYLISTEPVMLTPS